MAFSYKTVHLSEDPCYTLDRSGLIENPYIPAIRTRFVQPGKIEIDANERAVIGKRNAAFSFAPSSILSLTICASARHASAPLYHKQKKRRLFFNYHSSCVNTADPLLLYVPVFLRRKAIKQLFLRREPDDYDPLGIPFFAQGNYFFRPDKIFAITGFHNGFYKFYVFIVFSSPLWRLFPLSRLLSLTV